MKKQHRAFKIWEKMSFWGRIERTLGILGGSAVILEALMEATPVVTAITAGSTILAQSLAVWFDDDNQDGIADIFQDAADLKIRKLKPEAPDENIP